MLRWKASIFLSLWALGPGTEHPWMPEPFIIWQPGSAVQFYLLAGGKRSTTHCPHSKQGIKGGRDGDKGRESEKQSFMQKQPLESSLASHGPQHFYFAPFPLLLHLASLFASFFWCVFAPEVKCLSLYNLQQWIAPSDGCVESKVGEGDAGEAEQRDLWCAPFLFGEKQSRWYHCWNTKNRHVWGLEDCDVYVGVFKEHLTPCFASFDSLWNQNSTPALQAVLSPLTIELLYIW